MNRHQNRKHGVKANKKGRSRKYESNTIQRINEKKYGVLFFNNDIRRQIKEEIIDVHNIVYQTFYFIYNGKYANKFYSHPKSLEENSILKNLYNDEPISNEDKNKKNCDDIFYEYLKECRDKTNKKYFSFLLKFIIIFRECYCVNQTVHLNEEEKKNIIGHLSLVKLPKFCNDFYYDFLSKYNYFDLFEKEKENENENENKNKTIIEAIQHFCYWLYKNKYTPYLVSLA